MSFPTFLTFGAVFGWLSACAPPSGAEDTGAFEVDEKKVSPTAANTALDDDGGGTTSDMVCYVDPIGWYFTISDECLPGSYAYGQCTYGGGTYLQCLFPPGR